MGLPEATAEGQREESSPRLDREDGGAAAAALAAAEAAAAADGLVFRGSHAGCEDEGPDGASDIDAMDARSPHTPSGDVHSGDEGMQQQQHSRARGQQSDATAEALSSSALEGSSSGSGLPFRQVINAVCTSTSLYRLSEAFPFIEKAPCICSDSTRCSFSSESGPSRPMQDDDSTARNKELMEKEPFSLFAPPAQASGSLSCSRHASASRPVDGSRSSDRGASGASPSVERNQEPCSWETFANSLDKELDGIIDKLALMASISPVVFASPRVKEARALKAAMSPPAEEPAAASSGSASAVKAESGAAARGAPSGAHDSDGSFPSVESGGIFAAVAAVELQCKEIKRKFADKVAGMRSFQLHGHRRPPMQQQLKAYQPLPPYGRGQQMPLFPYRNTVPSPPSLQELRTRRGWVQRMSEKRGGWEVREELPHVNASFSDAAWFCLGCGAGRVWRHLLHSSDLTLGEQLETLKVLQGDDLVEGCFVIDTIRKDSTVSRRVVAGRRGRREFMQALCSSRAVVRGWVVRCDKDRDLMLVRLVGVEVYPLDDTTLKAEDSAGKAGDLVKQEIVAKPNGRETAPADSAYLNRRLLKAEADIGSSGFYAALPLAAIPRYEFIGGQASGCCGRFVCAGTAVRVCLARSAAVAGNSSFNKIKREPTDGLIRQQQPLLDEVTLNAAHAHVEATFVLPDCFSNSVLLSGLLQEPLGFSSSLPHDAAHPQPEEADFEEIRTLQVPSNRDAMNQLLWWDGGSKLLHKRLAYVLRSSGSFANPTATHRQLHAFSVLQWLGLAPFPNDKESSAVSGSVSGSKKRSGNDSNRAQVYTDAESWETWLKRLSDGCFVSFFSTACPCDAIRVALARAEKDSAVRGGGVGKLLAQQQGADWAKRRLKAGVACARRKQLDQALQLYDSALQLRPDYADALVARGAAHANKAKSGVLDPLPCAPQLDYEKAVADLDAALALEPNNKNAAKYRAIVAERMGQKDAQAEPSGANATTTTNAPPQKPKQPSKPPPSQRPHPEKVVAPDDHDRTPSPERKCESPEDSGMRELTSTRGTTGVRKTASSTHPLIATRNALTSAAAAANAVLEQASAAGMGIGAGAMSRPSTVIERFRNQHEQQRQQLLLLEQQKRRAEMIQKQMQQSQDLERQLMEKKQKQQQKQLLVQQQILAQANSLLNKDKSHKDSQKKSKSKRKRKHSDSSSGGSSS
ncbi:hypothetical protein Emed_005346 [Eimeria media]